MSHRSTMPSRPWLTGTQYDKYDTPDMLHLDVFAYEDAQGYTYFEVLASLRGKKPVARSVYRHVHEFGVISEVSSKPIGCAPLRWKRETHDQFKRVHHRLLAVCRGLYPEMPRTILCHYVKPYDADPWPRNTINTYKAPVYKEGAQRGRPRKDRKACTYHPDRMSFGAREGEPLCGTCIQAHDAAVKRDVDRVLAENPALRLVPNTLAQNET